MEIIANIEKDKTPVLFGTVKVIYTPNVFEDYSKNIEIIALHGRMVKQYIQNYEEPKEDDGYIVYINGIEVECLDTQVMAGDILHIFPYMGKSGIGRALGSILIAVASYYTAGAVGAAYGATAGAIAGAVTTVAGGMILNSVFPPIIPQSSISRNTTESKNYTFAGISTSRSAFAPIPVLYGTFHTGGTEINKRIYYEDGDDWMEIQLALCHGIIDEITEEDIYINGQSYKNVANQGNTIDSYWGYTDGAFDQPIVSRFGDRNFLNTDVQKRLVYQEDYIFETSSTLIDNFEIHLTSSSKGMYKSNNQGALSVNSATVEISYRKAGDTVWIPIQEEENIYATEYEYEKVVVYIDNGEGSRDSGGLSSGGGFGGYGGLDTGTGAAGGMLA